MLEIFISLFGMGKPRNGRDLPEIPTSDWRNFLGAMDGYVWLVALVSVLVILGLYAWSVRRRKLHSPSDFFAPYGQNWFLLITILTWFAMFAILWISYDNIWPRAASPAGYAAIAASLAALITFVLAAAAMLIPGVTPPYLRYRPWASVCLGRGKSDTGVEAGR